MANNYKKICTKYKNYKIQTNCMTRNAFGTVGKLISK